MKLQIINPVERPEWDAQLLRSNDHSFFHTSAWAKVLERTYRFKPCYLTAFEAGRLAVLLPVMEVRNPFGGKRGISLPFSDQCPPHVLTGELLPEAIGRAIEHGGRNRWKHIEWRDNTFEIGDMPPWETYYVHDINLRRTEESLFSSLGDGNRRNIRKAARESVTVRIDRTLDSIREFYRLNLKTRKRHGIPPQPFAFFRNIHEHVISKDYGLVLSANHSGRTIASSIFLHFGTKAIYKYGASDTAYHHLRPNNLIMWEAMRWYRRQGFESLSLARTETDNHGLLQYKRVWGAKESLLKYFRYDIGQQEYVPMKQNKNEIYRRIFAQTPVQVLRLIGRMFYRYVA